MSEWWMVNGDNKMKNYEMRTETVSGWNHRLDQNVVRHHSETGSTVTEADTMVEIQEKHYAEFCAEILRGTPIIVVDNNNIKESEYLHFVEFAHKEHYIASIVTLPPPTSIELASQRSSHGVTPN